MLLYKYLHNKFGEEQDSLFHLYLDHEDNSVQLNNLPFVKRGRADQWLTLEVFELTEPHSIEAEQAIERTKELQLMENPPKKEVHEISEQLKRLLAPDDEFWRLWAYFAKQQGKYDIEHLEEKAPFLASELKRQSLADVNLPLWEEFRKFQSS